MTRAITATQVDALLPQTQCGQCGFDGCEPYAEALVRDETTVDRCPPGGQEGADALARLLGVTPRPLDPSCGTPKPLPERAEIIEDLCIGCTRCIQACPVDAIMGAAKRMHTVIAEECTGCELCVAPCPVDCIRMVPVPERAHESTAIRQERRDLARARFQARNARLAQERAQRSARRHGSHQPDARADPEARIAQLMARVKQESGSREAGGRPPAVAAAIARAKARREAANNRENGNR